MATESPSVLHVVTSLGADQGGPAWTVPSHCLAAAEAGLRVGAAFLSRRETLSPKAAALETRGIEMLSLGPARAMTTLWRAVGRYDIVQVYGLWTPFCHLGALFARLQGKPLVIMPAGMLEPWALRSKRLKKLIGYKLYQERDLKTASVLLATAAQEAAHIRDLGLRNPIAVIPETVDTPADEKERLAPAPGRRRLLFLSRIHPKKGLLDLVRAVACLRPIFERENWIVTLAGPDRDGHLSKVQEHAARSGVARLFEYAGAVTGNQKWDLYRSADLFVLPTLSENFGLVVGEALACGTPVLTTRAAPWGGIESHRCGWWHEVGPFALQQALASALLTSGAELKRMGQRGRNWIRADFSLKALSQRLTQCYRWLRNETERPAFVACE